MRAIPGCCMVGREGHKEGMLKSYKFESRPVPVQEIETDAKKTPFEIAAPSGNTLEAGQPVQFSVKLTRETRATRSHAVSLDRRKWSPMATAFACWAPDRPAALLFRHRSPKISRRF